MSLLRPLLLVAIVAAAAVYATQLRMVPAGAAATAQPLASAAASVAVDGPLDTTIDLAEHGRGPVVPASTLTGFALPPGYAVPDDPELLPNSPRDYRGGYHEGVDFPLSHSMPVYAAKAGRVIRVDTDYVEWSAEEQIKAEDEGARLGHTPERTLDKLRGRQVWIDHGNGVVTRYAHLESVEPIALGTYVAQGTLIGRVGNSGTKEGPHLHIEIRVGDGYLGDGLTGDALLRVLHRAFSVSRDG